MHLLVIYYNVYGTPCICQLYVIIFIKPPVFVSYLLKFLWNTLHLSVVYYNVYEISCICQLSVVMSMRHPVFVSCLL